MKWTEVKIQGTTETEDILTSILYDWGATGLAIEDPLDIENLHQSKEDWDFVDSSLINFKIDGLLIKAYFSEEEDLDKKVENIKNSIKNHPNLKEENHKITITQVDEDDWAESWKQYYKPLRIGENIIIKPTWEDYEIKEKDIIIELDPGMAFGTGTHETTMMCTEALEKYVKNNNIVYDIGTGSGILSIVAAKLGAKKVIGVDLDLLCVKVAKENINLNNVDNIVEIKNGDLLEVIEDKADIIVSNIIAEVIAGMTKDLKRYLNDDGIFIASGIILEKLHLVQDSLIQNGFKIIDIKKTDVWACVIATK